MQQTYWILPTCRELQSAEDIDVKTLKWDSYISGPSTWWRKQIEQLKSLVIKLKYWCMGETNVWKQATYKHEFRKFWELSTGWEEPVWEILPVHKTNIVSFPHPQIQPNMDWKYSNKRKFPESSKRQNVSLPYFATICISFTLYLQLFTYHLNLFLL